jgi:hypothetical protein
MGTLTIFPLWFVGRSGGSWREGCVAQVEGGWGYECLNLNEFSAGLCLLSLGWFWTEGRGQQILQVD